MSRITFNNRQNHFFNTLKSSVDGYFQKNKLKKTGNWKLYLKAVILIPLAIVIYISLLIFPLHWFAALLLCAVLGFALACIGFNVMHDACHGSYSTRSWVNNLFSLSMNVLGSAAFIWKLKHNIVHHTYTNIDGIDDDIAKSPVFRECKTQRWHPAHRFQHYYIFLLYGFSSLSWVFGTDYKKYFSQKVHNTPFKKMNFKEHIIFWLSKILYMVIYIIIPAAVWGWGAWAIGFITMHFVLGFVLAIVFQLAHVVEHVEFEAVGKSPKKIENEWAVYQVKTTADFAPKNKLITWLTGGLNYQIEHHLFPKISHVHYPAISNIVKEACRKFGIEYHYFPTMMAAVASHYRLMKEMGKRPEFI
ncbi:MAG: acyl-CoA desaturase [Chitinophagaceae bacterium]|nr:acyl-CoA desaturase [Chitinophagaceae bacterium]